MQRYGGQTLITSNRHVENRGKLLGDSAAVSAMLDRLLHHGHVLKCAREAGEPRPAAREKANDKTNPNSMRCVPMTASHRRINEHSWLDC